MKRNGMTITEYKCALRPHEYPDAHAQEANIYIYIYVYLDIEMRKKGAHTN